MKLSEDLLELLRGPSVCFLSTTMPDGSPQVTQTWVDTDGEHVLVNSVKGFVKLRNIERDPRVALGIADRETPEHYFQVRGRVIDVTTAGAVDHVNQLSQRYIGKPYPWYGGRDQVRVIITIEAEKVNGVRP